MPNVASHAEFFKTATAGNVAVVKDTGKIPQQFLLSGMFELDQQNFFMGAEGNYMPSNTFNHKFVNTRLTCNLIPVEAHGEIHSGQNSFNAFVANVRALE